MQTSNNIVVCYFSNYNTRMNIHAALITTFINRYARRETIVCTQILTVNSHLHYTAS